MRKLRSRIHAMLLPPHPSVTGGGGGAGWSQTKMVATELHLLWSIPNMFTYHEEIYKVKFSNSPLWMMSMSLAVCYFPQIFSSSYVLFPLAFSPIVDSPLSTVPLPMTSCHPKLQFLRTL